MNKVLVFFNEVKAEIGKIVWPTRSDLFDTLIVVSLLTIVFALILGLMDASISAALKMVVSI